MVTCGRFVPPGGACRREPLHHGACEGASGGRALHGAVCPVAVGEGKTRRFLDRADCPECEAELAAEEERLRAGGDLRPGQSLKHVHPDIRADWERSRRER